MSKIDYIVVGQEEQKVLFNKICDDIIQKTNEYREGFNERGYIKHGEHKGKLCFGYDLTDVGDFIGKAIAQNTCKNEKDLNIWAYDKYSFVVGFHHGYSQYDGTIN